MKKRFYVSDFAEVATIQSITYDLVERFKKRRKEAGLTQKELSERSGVSYGSIRRFESSGDVSLHSLLKISMEICCLENFNVLFKNIALKDLRDYL